MDKNMDTHLDTPVYYIEGRTDRAGNKIGSLPVSYTHLDVYKRQVTHTVISKSGNDSGLVMIGPKQTVPG